MARSADQRYYFSPEELGESLEITRRFDLIDGRRLQTNLVTVDSGLFSEQAFSDIRELDSGGWSIAVTVANPAANISPHGALCDGIVRRQKSLYRNGLIMHGMLPLDLQFLYCMPRDDRSLLPSRALRAQEGMFYQPVPTRTFEVVFGPDGQIASVVDTPTFVQSVRTYTSEQLSDLMREPEKVDSQKLSAMIRFCSFYGSSRREAGAPILFDLKDGSANSRLEMVSRMISIIANEAAGWALAHREHPKGLFRVQPPITNRHRNEEQAMKHMASITRTIRDNGIEGNITTERLIENRLLKPELRLKPGPYALYATPHLAEVSRGLRSAVSFLNLMLLENPHTPNRHLRKTITRSKPKRARRQRAG